MGRSVAAGRRTRDMKIYIIVCLFIALLAATYYRGEAEKQNQVLQMQLNAKTFEAEQWKNLANTCVK